MRRILITATSLLLAAAFVGSADAADLSALLNQANTMNYEEIDSAKTAKDRAGDNAAMTTFAETLQGDHRANQDALDALSRQKNVKLATHPEKADKTAKALDKLQGGKFNAAFLRDQITDHQKAISTFESASAEFKDDPNTELYIEQTIPVLKAHLEMARNLEANMGTGNDLNPHNNEKE